MAKIITNKETGPYTEAEAIGAIGYISAELAHRAGAWDGNAPEWFPEPPEWLDLWEEAIGAVRNDD